MISSFFLDKRESRFLWSRMGSYRGFWLSPEYLLTIVCIPGVKGVNPR